METTNILTTSTLDNVATAARPEVSPRSWKVPTMTPSAGTPVPSNPTTVPEWRAVLLAQHASLAARMRALFSLRTDRSDAAVHALADSLGDDSALLKHEVAFALGQMQNKTALPVLYDLVKNRDEDPMVRHEAAEALGAIADPACLEFLKDYEFDPEQVVAETAQVSLARIAWALENPTKAEAGEEPPVESVYDTVDPAPPSDDPSLTVDQLGDMLCDESQATYDRYRALFRLRNDGGEAAVAWIANSLKDKKSPLFRHEIAYVLGQIQDPTTLPALEKALANDEDHSMVRHEAAEAIGAIATPECVPILRKYAQDPDRVVAESCVVALDAWEFHSTDEFVAFPGNNKSD